jgi:cobalt-zinc-cadmium efflux system membrane fusion protein
VALISPSVDPETRTVRVRIEAGDRHEELRPGVFAQVEIASIAGGRPGEEVLAVSDSALQLVEGETSVFVTVPGEPGTFARRRVIVGREVGGFVPVLSGLAEGEEYVAQGAFILKAELGKSSAEHQH